MFHRTKVSNYNNVPCIHFPVMIHIFGGKSNNCLPSPRLQRSSLIYKVFVGSHFILPKFVTHLDVHVLLLFSLENSLWFTHCVEMCCLISKNLNIFSIFFTSLISIWLDCLEDTVRLGFFMFVEGHRRQNHLTVHDTLWEGE